MLNVVYVLHSQIFSQDLILYIEIKTQVHVINMKISPSKMVKLYVYAKEVF